MIHLWNKREKSDDVKGSGRLAVLRHDSRFGGGGSGSCKSLNVRCWVLQYIYDRLASATMFCSGHGRTEPIERMFVQRIGANRGHASGQLALSSKWVWNLAGHGAVIGRELVQDSHPDSSERSIWTGPW